MNIYSVFYLKGKLIAAMFLWQGASMQDCRNINDQYRHILPSSPLIKSGEAKLSDIRLTCEYHRDSPVKNGVKM